MIFFGFGLINFLPLVLVEYILGNIKFKIKVWDFLLKRDVKKLKKGYLQERHLKEFK